MAAASVLKMPQYDIVYPPSDGVDMFPTMVTTNIASYMDSTGAVQNLSIGASSNLTATAVNTIFVQHGIDDSVTFGSATGSNVDDYLRIDHNFGRVNLRDVNGAGVTVDTKDTYIGSAHFVESPEFLTLSMPTLTAGMIVDPPVAMQSTLAVALDTSLNQNLFVTGDTGMGGRLVTYGGIFTPELALYKSTTLSGASQVGYTMKINANDQMELIKYTFFPGATEAVAKRVAVFGNASLQSTDVSDNTYAASLISSSGATVVGGGTIGGIPGITDTGISAFTIKTNNSMYTMNAVAIGTSNYDPTIALTVAGSLVATTGVSSPAFLTTSDERLKDLYLPLDGAAALSGIMGLSPLEYSWKSDDTHFKHAGFTAQNIGAQLPLAVKTTVAGDMTDALHIDNTAVLAYLVAAVKELGARLV